MNSICVSLLLCCGINEHRFRVAKAMAGKPITKKIINSPETCVDDNLRGIVTLSPALHLHPKHRVITYRLKADTKRVAVIGGGGSGHEPFAGGMVGPGMLSGSVAGSVFASPPTGHVLYAIMQTNKYHSGGVFVVIGNYTGDRLNFGKAIEKAKFAGVKVDSVIVGEDVASCKNKTGGRGMIGEVYLYKMCGALSAKGYDLASIKEISVRICNNVATLGVCLTPCSLPGQPPLFEIAQDEMELGAGVHGEAGITKMKIGTAKEIVSMILEKIIQHMKLKAGDRVVAAVNNLGGTSIMEMNIVAAEIKEYLESKQQITLERIFSGPMKSSLEMHGIQICLLHLTKEDGDLWLELIDYPTSCLGWIGSDMSVRNDEKHGDEEGLVQSHGPELTSGPTLTTKQQELLRGSLQAAAEELVKNESLLNRLDSGCGDGDCGTTVTNFGKAILSYIKTASAVYPSNILWDLSEIAETDMGGSSGGLYSLGLAAASQTFVNGQTNDVAIWLSAWESAMKAITKYGGAEPGDRTMLDTLHQAAEVYKQNMSGDFKTLLRKTAEAAEKGCKATAGMAAKAGRASYVASEYTKDEDAGARAAAIWLQAIFNHIDSNY